MVQSPLTIKRTPPAMSRPTRVESRPSEETIAYARRWLPLVEEALDRYIAEESDVQPLLATPMRHLCDAGGKRFRPLLAFAACELVGADPRLSVSAAAAIELFHTSSLILDDLPCMDDACVRRGKPPVHHVYGEATAILAALALFNLGHRLLATIPPSGDATARSAAHVRIARALGCAGMIGGQQLDLALAKRSIQSTPDRERDRLTKTAALMSASLVAGASIGSVSATAIDALAEFGNRIGCAFQLADDALDRDEDQERASGSVEQHQLRASVEEAILGLRAAFPEPVQARVVLEGLATFAIERAF